MSIYVGSDYVGEKQSLGGVNDGFIDATTPSFSTKSVRPTTTSSGYYVAYSAAFNFSTAMSGSIWFKLTTASAIGSLFSQYNSSGFVGKWLMQMQADGKIQVSLNDTGNTVIKVYRTTGSYDDGSWYHFAFTYSTTNGLKVYVNGSDITSGMTKVTDGANNALNTATNAVLIGGRWDGSTGATNSFNGGNLDDPSLFSIELSAGEISEIYNSGVPADLGSHSQVANLSGYWLAGDDASDTTSTLIDQTANANNGAASGTMAIDTDAP